MQEIFRAAFASALIAGSFGCKPNEPLQAAATPEPPAFPAPPALPVDPSLCAVRHVERDDKAWQIETYAYDAEKRVMGNDWIRFDAAGRMTSRRTSDDLEIQTYDAHDNLEESTLRKGEELIHGTHWDNRYEGSPPRLVARSTTSS